MKAKVFVGIILICTSIAMLLMTEKYLMIYSNAVTNKGGYFQKSNREDESNYNRHNPLDSKDVINDDNRKRNKEINMTDKYKLASKDKMKDDMELSQEDTTPLTYADISNKESAQETDSYNKTPPPKHKSQVNINNIMSTKNMSSLTSKGDFSHSKSKDEITKISVTSTPSSISTENKRQSNNAILPESQQENRKTFVSQVKTTKVSEEEEEDIKYPLENDTDKWTKMMEERFRERKRRMEENCPFRNSYSHMEELPPLLSYYVPEYKLIACVIAKSGASTWKTHLMHMRGYRPPERIHNEWVHKKLRVREVMNKDNFARLMKSPNVTKLISVRHPISRLISAYADKFSNGRHEVPRYV
ncbi:hypothetical protein SK128_003067 [Halocaridina rubra]|uniref:Carbohydrate sulfotransferase n=1 Tax=Halocaridina rubra TaxID=373956 RepID=A0AAN8WBG1_HALRR